MFHVGQKVVCVDEKPRDDGGWRFWFADDSPPRLGEVYTIRRMFLDPDDGVLILQFYEIERCKRAVESWGQELGYGAFRFRPIVERKTDISIFTAMLTPAGKKEHV